MIDLNNFLFFISMIAIGLPVEIVLVKFYDRHNHSNLHFSFFRYILFIILPIIGFFILVIQGNLSLIKVFVVFAFIGTFIEWLIGYSYQSILRKNLWTYHRLSIQGHTSFLSIPLWGLSGVLFWLLAKLFV